MMSRKGTECGGMIQIQFGKRYHKKTMNAIYIVYHPGVAKVNICTKSYDDVSLIKTQLERKYGFVNEWRHITMEVLPWCGKFLS